MALQAASDTTQFCLFLSFMHKPIITCRNSPSSGSRRLKLSTAPALKQDACWDASSQGPLVAASPAVHAQ
jgi:hypothetical protein